MRAADPEEQLIQDTTSPSPRGISMNASSGYDSIYMYKGVNVIPGDGIVWVSLDPLMNLGVNDFIDLPLWYAVALGDPSPKSAQNYREFDVPVIYTHKLGDFSLSAAYDLYLYFNYPGFRPAGEGIQHELHLGSSYTRNIGAVSWTPSLDYYYELGNANGTPYGCINPGSSLLCSSVTTSVPLIRDQLTFDPNVQYNLSFGYSANQSGHYVWGGNNVQISLPLTWHLGKHVSIKAYAAYSYQWQQLIGTSPGTIWGGGSVSYSF